jgi:hypothetical protein
MKGLIWNCQGFGSPDKHKFVKEMLREEKVEFIGIQEMDTKEFSKE